MKPSSKTKTKTEKTVLASNAGTKSGKTPGGPQMVGSKNSKESF